MIVVAFLLVRDPFSRDYPSIPQPIIKKSEISQLFDNYYLAQIHPDDPIGYTNRGFTQAGVYELNTKKLVAPFPYQRE